MIIVTHLNNAKEYKVDGNEIMLWFNELNLIEYKKDPKEQEMLMTIAKHTSFVAIQRATISIFLVFYIFQLNILTGFMIIYVMQKHMDESSNFVNSGKTDNETEINKEVSTYIFLDLKVYFLLFMVLDSLLKAMLFRFYSRK